MSKVLLAIGDENTVSRSVLVSNGDGLSNRITCGWNEITEQNKSFSTCCIPIILLRFYEMPVIVFTCVKKGQRTLYLNVRTELSLLRTLVVDIDKFMQSFYGNDGI